MENGSAGCIGLIFLVITIINSGQIIKTQMASERNQRKAETAGDEILEGRWYIGIDPHLIGFFPKNTSQLTQSTVEQRSNRK